MKITESYVTTAHGAVKIDDFIGKEIRDREGSEDFKVVIKGKWQELKHSWLYPNARIEVYTNGESEK